MNYIEKQNSTALDSNICASHEHFAHCCTDVEAEGTLTNYKKVVDIDNKYNFFNDEFDYVDQVTTIRLDQKYYGLFEEDIEEVKKKLYK